LAHLIGLMQDVPLQISALLRYADEYHSGREIVSRDHRGREHRYSPAPQIRA
jgi:hypothetical protein